MVNQTTIQNARRIWFGSAKIEVADDVTTDPSGEDVLTTAVNIGAANNVSIKENIEPGKVVFDNAGELDRYVKSHTFNIEFDMMELDFAKLNTMRGGIDTYTTIAGSPVTVTNESHTFVTGQNDVTLTYKMGDGTEVGSIVVKDTTLNTTYVLNTHYVVSRDDAGYTTITKIPAAGIGTTDVIKVSYSYTPNAGYKLSSGGKIEIAAKVWRLTNVNQRGKKKSITVYKGFASEGIQISYQPDTGSDKPNSVKCTIEAIEDTTRTAGDQLFVFYMDEDSA